MSKMFVRWTRGFEIALWCFSAVVAGCLIADKEAEFTEAPEDAEVSASSDKVALQADGLPAPIGPYSPAVRSGDFLFLSGQIGKLPGGDLAEGGVTAETRQTMENIKALLTAGGLDFSNVVQAQVFLADIGDYAAMNEVYATYFEGLTPPARAAVEVAAIPAGARVEIMMTARR